MELVEDAEGWRIRGKSAPGDGTKEGDGVSFSLEEVQGIKEREVLGISPEKEPVGNSALESKVSLAPGARGVFQKG